MAISHAHLLLLPLLVSLFFLPAALGRSVTFITCKKTFDYPVAVNTVEISPGQGNITRSTNANFTITADTSIDILDGATVLLYITSGHSFQEIRSYPLCDILACPVKPGPIVLTFSNVFTKEELRPRLYRIHVGITEKEDELHVSMPEIMCIYFYCVSTGKTSLLRQVTE